MKRLLSVGLSLIFIFLMSSSAWSLVWVTSVIENNPPSDDCTPTSLTVSGDLSATHSFAQTTVSVTGSNISIGVEYLSGIGIPVITPFTQIADLGTLSSGTYTVTTQGILDGVVQSSVTSTLVVGSCCGTSADFTYPPSICLGDEIILTNSSTGAVSQEWFEDGNLESTNLNYAVTPTVSGGVVFQLVTSDGSCQDTAEYTVNVLELPTVTALTPNQATYCEGEMIVITNNAMNATSYNWTESGTFLSAFSTLQTTATTAGQHFYKLIISNGVCLDSMDVTINVNASPTIDNFNVSQTSICLGESIDLTSSSTGATTIEWFENGSFLGNGNNQIATPSADGNYMYQLEISAANGCTDSMETTVAVNPLPTIDTFTASDTTLCLGDTISFTSSSSNASTFKWFENGVNLGNSNNFSTAPSPSGVYTYQLLVELGNCFDSTQHVIEVVDLPVVDLGPDTNDCLGPVVLDAGPGLNTYLWQDQSTNQTLTPATSGIYSVTVTDVNGCSTTDELLFESCSGLAEEFVNSISVFPNPVESILFIDIKEYQGNVQLILSDLRGNQLLHQHEITAGSVELNMNKFPSGIYYIHLHSDICSKVFRIVKE